MNGVQQRSCQERPADGGISLHPNRPEVAQLKLNADKVVLSACNTAAGDEGE